jgi:DNA-binding GntR family transcriptional regulator
VSFVYSSRDARSVSVNTKENAIATELATTIGGQHTPLRDQVLIALRQRIVNGDYPPGERLTEDRLAEDFGVSRNPVREALRVVEAEGFVNLVPRRGAFVARPDASTIADMFAMREQLETMAARLAAERATAPDVVDLRALLDAARDATSRVDLSRVAELNSELHMRVVAISGNKWLASIATSLYLQVQWVFRIGAAHRAPHSWIEHIRLVDAIEAGDPDEAEAAARSHVDAAAIAALENVEEG